jgi:hypothetical protein
MTDGGDHNSLLAALHERLGQIRGESAGDWTDADRATALAQVIAAARMGHAGSVARLEATGVNWDIKNRQLAVCSDQSPTDAETVPTQVQLPEGQPTPGDSLSWCDDAQHPAYAGNRTDERARVVVTLPARALPLNSGYFGASAEKEIDRVNLSCDWMAL